MVALVWGRCGDDNVHVTNQLGISHTSWNVPIELTWLCPAVVNYQYVIIL